MPEQSNRRWKSHQDIEATKGRTTGSTTEINPSVVVKAKTIVKFAEDVKNPCNSTSPSSRSSASSGRVTN